MCGGEHCTGGFGWVEVRKASTRSLTVTKQAGRYHFWGHVRGLWLWFCPLQPHLCLIFLPSSQSCTGGQCDDAAAGWQIQFSFLQRTSAFSDLLEDTESSAVFHLSPSGISSLFPLSDSSSVMNFPVSVPRLLCFLLSHGVSSTPLYQPFIIFHTASIMLPPLHLLNANVMHLLRENVVEEDSLIVFELVL